MPLRILQHLLDYWPMRLRSSFYLFVLLLLGACAEAELAAHVVKQVPITDGGRYARKSDAPPGYFKVGKAYRIKGRRYYPKETYKFTQTGIASWYGPNFHGKMTANGEIFDQNELTAAHKTLQMPSLVRVTNLGNGRSLVVRVNDRGPYSHGRVIDLSKRAAELLGFKEKGTAKVRIDILPQESRAVAEAAKAGKATRGAEVLLNQNKSLAYGDLYNDDEDRTVVQYGEPRQIAGEIENGRFMPDPVVNKQEVTKKPRVFIQAASFSNPQNAENLALKLREFETTTIQKIPLNNRVYHRVRVGPFADVQSADAVLAALTRKGHTGAKIVID